MTVAKAKFICHSEIARFAENRVNLKREHVTEYRRQVNRLREKIDGFVKENPNVGLRKMLLSGSLAKGTALSALNDIDVAVYVQAGKAPSIFDRRRELLEWLAQKLREAYPQMAAEQVVVQTHTVRISFRGTGLDVEVAPVWYDSTVDKNAQDLGYLINCKTGEPVLTSIPMHIEFARKRKIREPQHYAQTVRLIKWWVRHQKAENSEFRLRSFLAEMLCARVSDSGITFSDYPEALSAVFEFIVRGGLDECIMFDDYYPLSTPSKVTQSPLIVHDPVNVDNNVTGDYTDADKELIERAAGLALDAITEAEFAITKGRALECWRRILGPSFSD